MDPAHVCLVNFELKKDEFEFFDIDQPLEFVFDMEKFNSILDRLNPKDSLSLEYEDESTRIYLVISGEFPRTFFMDLLDATDTSKVKIPKMDFNTEIKLNSSILRNLIRDVETIKGGEVTFEIIGENLSMKSTGEGGGVEGKFNKSHMIEFKNVGPLSNTYSMEYLSNIIRGSSLADEVKIEMGNNIPLKIEFRANGLKLEYMLAPKIKEE
jgi:proliferating cell nuclear antigen